MPRTLFNILFAYGAVVVIGILQLINVPLFLKVFGESQYGIIALVTSSLLFLNLFGFGMPWACATAYAKAVDKSTQIQILKKSFTILFVLIILLLMTILCFQFLYGDWSLLFGNVKAIQDHSTNLIYQFIFISLLFGVVKLPGTVISLLLIYTQRLYLSRLIDVLSNACILVSICFVMWFKLDLVSYAYLYGSLSLILSFIGVSLFFLNPHFCSSCSSSVPKVRYLSLAASGMYFFINNIGGIIIYNSDYFVISHFLNSITIAKFAVLIQAFTALMMAILQIQNALSPHYPQHYKNKQYVKMQKLYNRTNLLYPMIGGLILLGMLSYFKPLVVLWTQRNTMFIGYPTVFVMGLFFFSQSVSLSWSSPLSALGKMRSYSVMTIVTAIVNLVFSIFMVQRFGVVGVALGSLVAQLGVRFPWLIYLFKQKMGCYITLKHKNTIVLAMLCLLLSGMLMFTVNHVVLTSTVGTIAILIYSALCFWMYRRAK